MSRKVRFSHNWKRAKARVQRIHARIGNARRDYLHKCSTTISQNHALVCIEDLRVQNLSSSAKGTVERPGKHVRAKAHLNRAILDQGWFEFRRQLDYKMRWKGGWLIAVPSAPELMCPLGTGAARPVPDAGVRTPLAPFCPPRSCRSSHAGR